MKRVPTIPTLPHLHVKRTCPVCKEEFEVPRELAGLAFSEQTCETCRWTHRRCQPCDGVGKRRGAFEACETCGGSGWEQYRAEPPAHVTEAAARLKRWKEEGVI